MKAKRRNAPYHLLRWQSGRHPVPRVELSGYALALISRPPFTLTDAPQRVAIPFPAPYPTGQGVISVEGTADGAVISISPAWHLNSLPGSASLDVIWTPKDPC